MAKLRIVFMGTAELACPILQALRGQADFEIAAVVTQPDRPQGRNLEVQGSAVKKLAGSAGLPVLQPEKFNPDRNLRKAPPTLERLKRKMAASTGVSQQAQF